MRRSGSVENDREVVESAQVDLAFMETTAIAQGPQHRLANAERVTRVKIIRCSDSRAL